MVRYAGAEPVRSKEKWPSWLRMLRRQPDLHGKLHDRNRWRRSRARSFRSCHESLTMATNRCGAWRTQLIGGKEIMRGAVLTQIDRDAHYLPIVLTKLRNYEPEKHRA